MRKIIQRVEYFFGQGTLGAAEGKSLENVIDCMNKEGWKIDQITPLTFRLDRDSTEGLNVTYGVLLCSKVE